MSRLTRSLLGAVVLAAGISSASAAVQLYSFTATVNPSSQGLDLTGPNSVVTGTFSFDDAAPVSSGPFGSGAAWYSALQSFSFAMGPLSGTLTSPGGSSSILIGNDFPQGSPPLMDIFSIQPQAMTGPARLGNALVSADLNLIDSSLTVFSSSALPPSLNFGSFSSASLHVNYGSGNDLYATINSITPVPEASEWAMMLAGLGVIGAVARRRRGLVSA